MTTESVLKTLSPPDLLDTGDSMERSLGLSLEAFPLLKSALLKEGQALRSELLEFAHALHYKRAPRLRRNLIARIYIEALDFPEVAIVRDLSSTGVRLWVDGDRSFDAANPQPYLLEVRVPGSRSYVGVQARLVRVAEHRLDRGVELGFRFTEEHPNDGLRRLLTLVQRDLDVQERVQAHGGSIHPLSAGPASAEQMPEGEAGSSGAADDGTDGGSTG